MREREENASPTTKTIKSELIDLIQRGGVLEIVLDYIDVVGGSQKTCEFGCL